MKSLMYYCTIKMLGFPFLVHTEEEAQKWVAEDPEEHYYREIEIRIL